MEKQVKSKTTDEYLQTHPICTRKILTKEKNKKINNKNDKKGFVYAIKNTAQTHTRLQFTI